ncbi:MAG: hypothetical protein AABX37_04525 [Nanoarchaeota archaeon]
MEDIKITLETLYDILRNEKKREDLQKMEATFFLDVVAYLKEKQALLQSKQQSEDMFAVGERDKLQYELKSIRRILKEIYEKREKKIIDIALNRSHTGSDIIDTSAMLYEEKEFYNRVLGQLNGFRESMLMKMFKGEVPQVPLDVRMEVKKEPEKVVSSMASWEAAGETKPEEGKTKIRFVHPMPSFVWKDMKVYGPYNVGEETDMYTDVAELIVRKGRAVKV